MPEPANLFLPWRDADGYNVVDSDGVRVASVPCEDARSYIVEAANAYPRLKAALDKALEACRLMLQADELGVKAAQYRYGGLERKYKELWLESAALERQALEAAQEALEMAEGRDGDA